MVKRKYKICMLGCYAVGKTSLVRKYIESIYSEDYQTTIGVKIGKKVIVKNDTEVTLLIWDIAGEDDFHTIRDSYLSGMSGYFLVIDSTRDHTLDIAMKIQERIAPAFEDVPFILVANKKDLIGGWELNHQHLSLLEQRADAFWHTSAKTGEGVENAFEALVDLMDTGTKT